MDIGALEICFGRTNPEFGATELSDVDSRKGNGLKYGNSRTIPLPELRFTAISLSSFLSFYVTGFLTSF